MSGKKIWLSSLAVALLGMSAVRGQGPGIEVPGRLPTQTTPPAADLGLPSPAGPGTVPAPTTDPAQQLAPGQQYTLSKWILGERSPGCCGPIGGNGPIGSELYIRNGMTYPINGNAMNINPGWDLEGGGRVLFFNRAVDAAWTVDLGVSNVFNPANKSSSQVTLLNVPVPSVNIAGQQTTVILPSIAVTPGNLNRTSMNLGVGRELWLLGTADSSHNDLNWRVGADVGGRWGTEKLEFNEIKHRGAVFESVFIGLHSDVEVPCGSVILQAGIRTEWGYTWSDVLQSQNNAEVMDINLTFTLGVRF